MYEKFCTTSLTKTKYTTEEEQNFYRKAIFSIQSQKQLKCSPGKFCYLSRSAFAPSFYTFYGITEAQNFENHVKSKTAYLHTDRVDLLV